MLSAYIERAVIKNMTTKTLVIESVRRVVSMPALRIRSEVLDAWSERRDRPWLALVAVPLAMNATGLVGLWWTWPPMLLGAAACTRAWRWSWVLALQLGAIGTEWAYVGAASLVQWPTQRLAVGAIWATVAFYFAGAGSLHRQFRAYRAFRRLL
jgi:hypothetical protein